MVDELSAVVLRDISVRFNGPPEITPLQAVSLELPTGGSCAIMGESGSGKSTLLDVLGLLRRPTSGDGEILGVRLSSATNDERAVLRANEIGFVFQQFHLLGSKSVFENIALGLVYTSEAIEAQQISSIADAVGLASRLGTRASHLSGGEQQRVSVARALVKRPRLLLCDEPTGNLDDVNSRLIVNLLMRSGEIDDVSRTTVIVTHDPGVAEAADITLHLRSGSLEQIDG